VVAFVVFTSQTREVGHPSFVSLRTRTKTRAMMAAEIGATRRIIS
jgi:hypothetical protein